MVDNGEQEHLLDRITERRRSIDAYLSEARPRTERLTMITIISSALAAVLNAGPALGGTDLTDSVSAALDLGGSANVWRPLCFLAMIVSVVAAISANLGKSKNAENRIISAETSNSELEGLQTLVEFHQVPLKEAVKMYQQSVTRVPFVRDESLTDEPDKPSR